MVSIIDTVHSVYWEAVEMPTGHFLEASKGTVNCKANRYHYTL